jgi:hypothetical protein
MTAKTEAMPTIGEIARRLNEPIHRIAYVIRSRNIFPAATVDNARVFTEADVAHIASELKRIDADKLWGFQ